MNILGINFGHDAGISLVRDGVFIRHWEKERHTRIRHAMGVTTPDLNAALKYLDLELDQVDAVAISVNQVLPILLDEKMEIEFHVNAYVDAAAISQIVSYTTGFYEAVKNPNHFFHSKFADVRPAREITVNDSKYGLIDRSDKLEVLAAKSNYRPVHGRCHMIDITLTVEGKPLPGVIVAHHLCHAYYAYAQGGYEDAVIVTLDAGCSPTFSDGGIYFGENGRVWPIVPHGFFFGLFYIFVSHRLGLGFAGSGKLMGLSAWGRPHPF